MRRGVKFAKMIEAFQFLDFISSQIHSHVGRIENFTL